MNNLDHRKVAAANRAYYAMTAHQYDETETCVVNPRSQQMLKSDLGFIVEKLSQPPAELIALDACGGSGNVALKLLKRGLKVTLCDISNELTSLCLARAEEHASRLKVINGEITDFLTKDKTTYDLIVYSSALHHLENFTDVLRLSYDRLKPGGYVYTVFDPALRNKLNFIAKIVLGVDYLFFKIRYHPKDILLGGMRKLRRFLRALFKAHKVPQMEENQEFNAINPDYLGVVAEYYARSGIDDVQLAADVANLGYAIVFHERHADARYSFFRKLLTSMQQVTSFKFLLQKPG